MNSLKVVHGGYPVVETGPFTSELTVTNFSGEAKAVSFSVVAGADHTVTFALPVAAGRFPAAAGGA